MTGTQTSLWTAAEAAEAAHGRLQGAGGWTADSLSIDTRTLQPGALCAAQRRRWFRANPRTCHRRRACWSFQTF